MRRARVWGLVLLWLAWTSPTASAEPVRTGAEFSVNSFTTGPQFAPDAVHSPGAGFFIVWSGPQDDDVAAIGIIGQFFRQNGQPQGTEFMINTTNPYDYKNDVLPKVDAAPDGTFVVVWEGPYDQDGSYEGVFGQRLAADGTKIGTQFAANAYTLYSQRGPDVASQDDGSFTVVWMDTGELGANLRGTFARRFSSDGLPLGTEFETTSFTTGRPVVPAIAQLSSGGFVIAWSELYTDGDGDAIVARLFASSGTSIGPPFQVNTYTSGYQQCPSVAPLPNGGFVVAWEGRGQHDSDEDVFGQRFDSQGRATGSQFSVNEFTTGTQERPQVSSAADGSFVVVWRSADQDSSGTGIVGRRYASDGTADGSEFQVNTYTTGDQGSPGDGFAVSTADDGSFVVVWQNRDQDGDSSGIFAQRFCIDPPTPPECGNVTCPGAAAVTSADALGALSAAVGLRECAACVCDVNASGNTTATDALIVLRRSLDVSVMLSCPAC